MRLEALLAVAGRRLDRLRPWPAFEVGEAGWQAAIDALAAGTISLTALWSDGATVMMSLVDEGGTEIAVAVLPAVEKRFPSVAAKHPPALRPERAIRDLFGLEPVGAPDPRAWLDHGRWSLRHPLGAGAGTPAGGLPYPFHPAEGAPLHQIPVGPVHAGIIEPGHFRFSCNGETVVRLEQRLGYVHKGIDRLMAGAPVGEAARIACRVSGDSAVAYGLAFARAVEAAAGTVVPPRAHLLRALMAELERLANHFGDIGAICNDASFSLMHAHMGALRERTLRAAATAFGHRLMMDRVVPGGVSRDLEAAGGDAIRALVDEVRASFEELVELYDTTASLQDRTVTTGIARPDLVRQYAAGGFVGRASGRAFDARRTPGYAPYDALAFEVPVRRNGDVDARVWIRIEEVRQSLRLVEQCLSRLPEEGAVAAVPDLAASAGREGLALVEGFRGDVLAWVRLGPAGTIAHAHLRDPSWFQWPLLEAAIEGNIVADFPLCNKSFNCSYSGHDL